VTLQMVADRVGVSRMTVSNAYSRPDQLSAELRARILAAADDLGYTGPDPAARALARGRTGSVGVLLTDALQYAFTDEAATSLLAAIASELASTGLALTLLTSNTTGELMPARDVPMDGALVYSCDEASTSVAWLLKRKLPVVFIDQARRMAHSSVNIDDRGGARSAAEHLVGLGHRRIAIVTHRSDAPPGAMSAVDAPGGNHVAMERMAGWTEPLSALGIGPTVINAADSTDDAGFDAARLFLDQPRAERPTAVVTFSDAVAAGVIRYAHEVGIDVPAELSVVGFDDVSLSHRTRPPLTTVHQDMEAKGRLASTELIAALHAAQRDAAAKPRHHVLATSLVVRGSTAAAPPDVLR
jgi:DNA-binding LacI/PurR family transcriptional regulator